MPRGDGDQKQQSALPDPYDDPVVSCRPPPLPPHLHPTAPPSPSLVDPYADLHDLELKDDAPPQLQSRPSLPPRPSKTVRPQSQPQPRPLPPGLDASQVQARQLTDGASVMTFRIHDVLVAMESCAFDDLPEMTSWLNRGIFIRGEFIRDSPLRVLVSLDALMQDKYSSLFRSWAQEMWDYGNGRRRGGLFRTSVIEPSMRYFFYGDSIGVLYERVIRKQGRTWCCCAAVYTAWE